MRKSEMNEDQITNRGLFVETLTAAGWRGLSFNQQFDEGLWTSPEASMEYSHAAMTLRLDFLCDDPRVILYLDSTEGKSLGLVFKCVDRLKTLLATIVGMQDAISSANIKDKSVELLAACPQMFKISESGDKLIPVKPKG